MEIKIVKAHEPQVKEMTVEELVKESFVGVKANGRKYMYSECYDTPCFAFVRAGGFWITFKKKLDLFKNVTTDSRVVEIQVFLNKTELYLWMAE